MNPIFVFLVILAAVIIWFLLSFAFCPLGKLIYQVWKDAVNEISKEESEEKSNER